tara:strand:- start:73514 stop:74557 length:1044 start_codon:yes stop_codon:yes gene_type:complete
MQGKSAYEGIRTWVDRMNQSKEVWPNNDIRFQLLAYDDQSNSKGVRRNLAKLIEEDNADIIIGPYSTNLIKTAAFICNEKKKLLWNHGGASAELHNQGYQLLVSSNVSCDKYLAGLGKVLPMLEYPKVKICRIFDPAGEFSCSVTNSALIGLEERYGAERLSVRDIFNRPDHMDEVFFEINAFDPDIIVYVGSYLQDIEFVGSLSRLQIHCDAICVGAAGLDQFWSSVGESGNMVIGPSQWESGIQKNINYGPDLSGVGVQMDAVDYVFMQAYGIGLIIEYCLSKCHSTDDRVLREFLNSVEIETIFGKFRIDPLNGRQIGHQVSLVQWDSGEKILLTSPNSAKRLL